MGVIAYDRTIPIVDIGVSDWWEYFYADYEETDLTYFDDIPSIAGANFRIIITGLGDTINAECGRVILGVEKEVGVTLDNVQSRLQDFSRKERDSFGNLSLVPRRTIRLVDYDLRIESPLVYSAQRRFRDLAAVPALYIGDKEMEETITFGVFTQFSIIINGHTITECSVSIEEF